MLKHNNKQQLRLRRERSEIVPLVSPSCRVVSRMNVPFVDANRLTDETAWALGELIGADLAQRMAKPLSLCFACCSSSTVVVLRVYFRLDIVRVFVSGRTS